MIRSKIIELLRNLSKKDFLEFAKFVNSPYFIKRTDVVVLFNHIKTFSPDFSHEHFTKEYVFAKTFPDKKFNDELFRKYLSELYKLFLEYLAYNNFKKDNRSFSKHLIHELISHQKFDDADKFADEYLSRLEASPVRNENYFYDKFVFAKIKNSVGRSKEVVSSKSNIQPETDNLLKYSMLSIIKQFSIILNDRRFDITHYDYTLMNFFVKLLEDKKFIPDPVTETYYLVLKSNLELDNTGIYKNLKSNLEKYAEMFEYDEIVSLHIFLQNYCYIQIEKGNNHFLRERFLINKIIVERKYGFVNGYILPVVFDSITINALLIGETDWTLKFINEFGPLLENRHRENAINFNLSSYYLFIKDYDNAIRYLSKVNLNEYFDKIKTKALYLMIYYECRMFDSALSLIDTFKHFLFKNKSVPDYVRERTNNFLLVINHLIKFRLGEIKKFDPELRNKQAIMNRYWVQQKINELT